MTWSLAGAIVGVAGIIAGALVSLIRSGRQHDIRPECAECHKKMNDEIDAARRQQAVVDSRVASLETSTAYITKFFERLEKKIETVDEKIDDLFRIISKRKSD